MSEHPVTFVCGASINEVCAGEEGTAVTYKTGEKPGKGRYQCTSCDEIITLDQDSDTLPPCPKCYGTTWRKL